MSIQTSIIHAPDMSLSPPRSQPIGSDLEGERLQAMHLFPTPQRPLRAWLAVSLYSSLEAVLLSDCPGILRRSGRLILGICGWQ